MATVTESTTPSKAFYAHVFDQAGAICRINNIIYFVAEDGDIVEVEPSMINFFGIVLGQMHMADAQRLADLMKYTVRQAWGAAVPWKRGNEDARLLPIPASAARGGR